MKKAMTLIILLLIGVATSFDFERFRERENTLEKVKHTVSHPREMREDEEADLAAFLIFIFNNVIAQRIKEDKEAASYGKFQAAFLNDFSKLSPTK